MNNKRHYDASARNIKTATDSKGLESVVRPQQFLRATPGKAQKIEKKLVVIQPHASSKVSEDTVLSMAKDRAAGQTYRELAEKYALSENYIKDALEIVFVGGKRGSEVLKGLLLENAIGAGMHVKKKMDELTPMQAGVVVGIMTKNFIDLDKHMNNTNEATVDYESIGQIAGTLASLNALAQDAGSD